MKALVDAAAATCCTHIKIEKKNHQKFTELKHGWMISYPLEIDMTVAEAQGQAL